MRLRITLVQCNISLPTVHGYPTSSLRSCTTRMGALRAKRSAAAWAAARATARSLMSTQTEAVVDWVSCSFSVTDETGEIVLEMPFSEVVEEDAGPQLN